MTLDIRVPIGLLFVILGVLLALYGALAENVITPRSLGVNIDLWWGIAMAVFGAIMLLLARRSAVEGRR